MKTWLLFATTICVMLTHLRLPAAVPESLEERVAKVIGKPRSFTLVYRFMIRDVPAGAERIEAWIPVPRTDEHQTVDDVLVPAEWSYQTVIETDHDNRFLRFDFSEHAHRRQSAIEVEISFRVHRHPVEALKMPSHPEKLQPGCLARYLGPNRLIPLEGRLAEEAQAVAGGEHGPLSRARALYDNIVETMLYDKTGTGWGLGDALYACDARKGNCTDFHSLFIGEARSLDIPARFIMGISIPENATEGNIPGYHCWAEFYVDEYGWVPVDASEAHKHPEKRAAFFGGLDANRVAFTVGRDIRIPGAASSPLNYVIYPHVEIDGKLHDGVRTEFSFRD